MTRVTISSTARTFIGVVGAILLAIPAYAAPVTINFSGTVDLSSVDGGLPLHVFRGSITWESTATAFEPDPFDPTAPEALYDPLSYTLFFDEVNYSDTVIGDGTGSGVIVLNDSELFSPGTPGDGLGFFLAFRPPFDIQGLPGDLVLVGALVGPKTMFQSNALPGDLTFLSLLHDTLSAYAFEPDGGSDNPIDPRGTLEVTPGDSVPEPGMLAMMVFGLAGAAARSRRLKGH